MSEKNQNSVLYMSLGAPHYIRQCIFSIWSLIAQHPSSRSHDITIFTDCSEALIPYFEDEENIQFIQLSSEEISEMKGKDDFIHRVKITCIQRCFQMGYQKILYFDSDTIIIKPIEHLFELIDASNSIMHLQEFSFDTAILDNFDPTFIFKDYLSTHTLNDPISRERITTSFYSSNAGVIGLDINNQYLLKSVLQLTDLLYGATHHHATEQFMFSYILGKYTKIHYCEETVEHYWYHVKKTVADLCHSNLLDSQFVTLHKKEKIEEILDKRNTLLHAFSFHYLIIQDQSYQLLYSNRILSGILHISKTLITGKGSWVYFKNIVYLLVKKFKHE